MTNINTSFSKRRFLKNNVKSKKFSKKIINAGSVSATNQSPPVYYVYKEPEKLTDQQALDLIIEDHLNKDNNQLYEIRNNLIDVVKKKLKEIVNKKIELYTLYDSNAAKKFLNKKEIKVLETDLARLQNELVPLENNCLKKVAIITNEFLKREKKTMTEAEKNDVVSNFCSSDKKMLKDQFMHNNHTKHTDLNLYNKYNPTKIQM